MSKHLYFICPTDHIEVIINRHFEYENYFITSLGNSISFNRDFAKELNELVESANVREITFALADDNEVFKDSLQIQQLKELSGLNNFYSFIDEQKHLLETLWNSDKKHSLLLFYYLEDKIQQLKTHLNVWFQGEITINAMVYRRDRKAFTEVHPKLFRWEINSLN